MLCKVNLINTAAQLPKQVFYGKRSTLFHLFKASEFLIAQKKPVGVPGISLLLGVNYVHFM